LLPRPGGGGIWHAAWRTRATRAVAIPVSALATRRRALL